MKSSSSSSSMYFPLLPSIFTKVNLKRRKKREEAEPQGQALAKRTCRGGETNKKNMLLVRRGAQCKLEAGAIVEELKNN